jgi:hypothetical protein
MRKFAQMLIGETNEQQIFIVKRKKQVRNIVGIARR